MKEELVWEKEEGDGCIQFEALVGHPGGDICVIMAGTQSRDQDWEEKLRNW